MTLTRLGVWCGVLAPLLWVLLLGVVGTMRPEFSHVTNYISELGERGSRTEFMVRFWAFGFTGVLYLCFALTYLLRLRADALGTVAALLLFLDGVGRIGAGVYACDPGCTDGSANQALHHAFATLGFSCGILAAILWGISFARVGQGLGWAAYTVGSGLLSLLCLVLMIWRGQALNLIGLLEHVASAVLSVWLLVFALRLLGRSELVQATI